MTHPFHPLHGGTFEVVDRRGGRGDEFLYLEMGDGQVHRVPAAWTSLGRIDEFVALSNGRSAFRVEDLVRLVELLEQLAEAALAESDRGRK